MNSKGRVGGLCAWSNNFLLSFANLRRQGWKTRRLRDLYFTNILMHKIRRETFNDIHAIQENSVTTERAFLRVATAGAASAVHAVCLDKVKLFPSLFVAYNDESGGTISSKLQLK